MFFNYTLRNIISRKSSYVIVLFIVFTVTLFVLINSLFDSTEKGLKQNYTRSFTGDFYIRPEADFSLSLFGDETPMTGELSSIPVLSDHGKICEMLEEKIPGVRYVSQVSGTALVEFENVRYPVSIFGINGKDYVDLMPSIKIERGEAFNENERGIMLSEYHAGLLGCDVGDVVQFSVASGLSARIRAARVTAIYSYPIQNSILNKMILCDYVTVSSLMDLGTGQTGEAIGSNESDLLDDDFDMDSLFSDSSDSIGSVITEESSVEEIEQNNECLWNFIVCRIPENKSVRSGVSELNSWFSQNGIKAEAKTWRDGAGSNAVYLFWMREIFNVGVIVVLLAGFIIINNTLIINVFNRTKEIGTLRAEGASRFYICGQCMLETMILTFVAGVLGCICGSVLSVVISGCNVSITNSFLVELFGTSTLYIGTSLKVMGQAMIFSLVLGILGWIYPVRVALSINPVQAMQGE